MTIVQIGTNRGYDDVTDLAVAHKCELSTILLVEPLSIHNSSIRKCYEDFPQAVIEHSCIVPNNGLPEIEFYYHPADGPGFEVASTDKQHVLKHSVFNVLLTEDGIVQQTVPCLTLSGLFQKHRLKEVDVLWIDAEGMDDRIIYSLDLDAFSVRKIVFEHLHVDGESLIHYLEDKGYIITRNIGLNGWSHSAEKK